MLEQFLKNLSELRNFEDLPRFLIISAVSFFLVIPLKKFLLFKLEPKSPRIKLSEDSWLSARVVKHTNDSKRYSCGSGFFFDPRQDNGKFLHVSFAKHSDTYMERTIL